MSDNDIHVRISGDSSSAQSSASAASTAIKSALDNIKAAFASIGNPWEKLEGKESLARLKENAEGAMAPIEKLKAGFAAFAAIIAGGEIGELAKESAEFGDSIERASQKTGIATDELQELRFAAKMVDVEFDALQKGLVHLSRSMLDAQDPTSKVARAFAAVGLHASELKSMKVEEVLARIADAFQGANDGATKATIATELFGARGGSELIPFLNKGSEGIDALKKKAVELGVVFGEEAIGQMAAYDDQLKQVHAVHEAMANQVGVALTPTLLGLSKAFQGGLQEGGPFKTFIEGLNEAIIIGTTVVSHLAQGFQELGTIIGATAAQIANPSMWNEIQVEADADLQKIAGGWEKFRDDMRKPIEGPEGGMDMGNGPDWDRNKKKDLQLDTKPPKPDNTIMAQLELELSKRKEVIAESNALNGTFYSMTKSAEADFWKSKIGVADAGSRASFEIEKKYVDLRVDLNKDEFDTKLASLQKEEEAIKYDYDKKLAIAAQEAALIKQKFGEQSKEYQKGLEAIQKLEQQKAEQSIKVQNQVAENRKTAALAGIDLEEQQAQLQVTLLQRTDAQLLADQQAFENRRYAIQVAALQERKALAATENNPLEQAKIDGQLEALEQQHQQKMFAIKSKEVQQETLLSRSLFSNLQQGFSSVVAGVLQGNLKMKDVLAQTYRSIAESLAQAVTKMVSDWLIGEVTKAAASKEANAVQIQQAAGEAAANAYNAIVGIPYVGPFLAPAAAAVAYAGVMAFARDGYDVPAGTNPITQLHAREMVLPAPVADTVRSAMTGSGNDSGGGDVHLHVHATDAQSVKRLFLNNGDHIATALRAQRRSFNPA